MAQDYNYYADRSQHLNLSDEGFQRYLQIFQNYLNQGMSPEMANEYTSQEPSIYIKSASPSQPGYAFDPMSNLTYNEPPPPEPTPTPTPTPAPVWDPRYLSGTYYTDQNAYRNAATGLINSGYNDTIGRYQTDYGQQMSNYGLQKENLGYDYGNQSKGLGRGRDESLSSQAGYFSAISPEAYQSQQGTYAGKTSDIYGEGMRDLTRQRDQGYQAIDLAKLNTTSENNQRLQAAEQQRMVLLDQVNNDTLGENGVAYANSSIPKVGDRYKTALNTNPYTNALSAFNLTPQQKRGTYGANNYSGAKLSPEQESALEQYLRGR